MYTIESLLHLGNPTAEQQHILNYMLDKGYKRAKLTNRGTWKYSTK